MLENSSIRISHTGSYLPPNVVSNEKLSESVDTSDEWIYSHTGIKERHFVSDEVASDLAINAIKSMQCDLSDIDGIIVATATPDYNGFPSTACIISEKLKMSSVNTAFDLAAGCSGFIYALEVASSLITSGSCNKIIVVGTEVLSKVIDFNDRNTCVLFGDGAGCVLLESGNFTMNSLLGCANDGADKLYISSNNHIHMDGRAVYKFAVKSITDVISSICEENNLSFDDIAYIIPHQANSRIIKAAAQRLKIDESKFYLNVERTANTSAASIPIALDELNKSGKLKSGDNLIFVGFGAGLTFGGNYIKWKN
jgi:3-oxoacyl-[acyl-carrier-protein] synthase-3